MISDSIVRVNVIIDIIILVNNGESAIGIAEVSICCVEVIRSMCMSA